MARQTRLTEQAVHAVFIDCLFKNDEDTSNHVLAEGLARTVGFHPVRLELHREEIAWFLAQLPDDFRQPAGQSFSEACWDRHGHLWTGLHLSIEQLLMLALATEQAEYTLPSSRWNEIPGGMPSFVVKA